MDAGDQRLSYYRAEREKAVYQVHSIDEDGWRFFAARGSEELREVTTEYRALQNRIIELLEQLIASSEQGALEQAKPLWEADHDVPP
jgi:hypothetical protein